MMTSIYEALRELSGDTTIRLVELRDTALRKGYGILISGSVIVGVIGILELLWHMEILKMPTKSHGKDFSKK